MLPALTLKNPEVEALAAEPATLTGESKTEAVRKELLDRRSRLSLAQGGNKKLSLEQFLKTRIWPSVPKRVLGKSVSKAELEDILGFGPGGV